jgi:3-phenylpropionate/cinnamic acid dioxygenase small subunit
VISARTDEGLLREIEALYFDYATAIDYEIDLWPHFFTEEGVYEVRSRENYERNLPEASILCTGQGMLLERVMAAQKALRAHPRFIRHAVTNIRIVYCAEEVTKAQANFAVYDTAAESQPRLFAVGRYQDVIVRIGDGTLRFQEKTCVYDGGLALSSFAYPL